MKIPLVQIGNSWGIRIPKAILQQCNIKDSVVVTIIDGNLILSPDNGPRDGWEDAFKKMAQSGDDKLLDTEIATTSFDKDEWEW